MSGLLQSFQSHRGVMKWRLAQVFEVELGGETGTSLFLHPAPELLLRRLKDLGIAFALSEQCHGCMVIDLGRRAGHLQCGEACVR